MIDPNSSHFYLIYAGICALLGVCYVRVKSAEGLTITTKEFKSFQRTFFTSYGLMILGESIASACFYRTLVRLEVPLETITKLYIVTVASTTFFNVALDVVDIGTRKNKCMLSAILFGTSMFTLYSRGHDGLYLLGRVAYGAANSLLQSAFNAYLVQQHTTMGFPDEWLTHTFATLTHVMALITAASGALGQTAASTGTFGAISLAMVVFMTAAAYMMVRWEQDFSGPRFMLSNFMFNITQSLKSLRSVPSSMYCTLVGGMAEGSILIFLFYWAPWLHEATLTATGSDISEDYHNPCPDIIVYSSYLVACIVGTYLTQIFANDLGEEALLQNTFIVASIFFFLGATVTTPLLVFTASIGIFFTIGAYWALINLFRNKYMSSEWRDGCTTISKLIAALICISALMGIHHSAFMTLMTCSFLMMLAGYLHFSANQMTPPDNSRDEE